MTDNTEIDIQINHLVEFLQTNNKLPSTKDVSAYSEYNRILNRYRKHGLEGFSKQVIDKLESFECWFWNTAEKKEKKFKELITFIEANNRCPYIKGEEKELYNYCANLRRIHNDPTRKGHLTKEMVEKLESYDVWYWDRNEETAHVFANGNVPRYTRIVELVEHIKKNERILKPSIDGKYFCDFVIDLRVSYKDNTLTQKEIDLLDSCKPYWFWSYQDECKYTNMQLAKVLISWITENNKIPSAYKTDGDERKLASIVNKFRFAYSGRGNSYIDEDIIKELETCPLWSWRDKRYIDEDETTTVIDINGEKRIKTKELKRETRKKFTGSLEEAETLVEYITTNNRLPIRRIKEDATYFIQRRKFIKAYFNDELSSEVIDYLEDCSLWKWSCKKQKISEKLEPLHNPKCFNLNIKNIDDLVELFEENDITFIGRKPTISINLGDYLKVEVIKAICEFFYKNKSDLEIFNEVEVDLYWIKILRFLIFVDNCGTNVEDVYYLYVESMIDY